MSGRAGALPGGGAPVRPGAAARRGAQPAHPPGGTGGLVAGAGRPRAPAWLSRYLRPLYHERRDLTAGLPSRAGPDARRSPGLGAPPGAGAGHPRGPDAPGGGRPVASASAGRWARGSTSSAPCRPSRGRARSPATGRGDASPGGAAGHPHRPGAASRQEQRLRGPAAGPRRRQPLRPEPRLPEPSRDAQRFGERGGPGVLLGPLHGGLLDVAAGGVPRVVVARVRRCGRGLGEQRARRHGDAGAPASRSRSSPSPSALRPRARSTAAPWAFRTASCSCSSSTTAAPSNARTRWGWCERSGGPSGPGEGPVLVIKSINGEDAPGETGVAPLRGRGASRHRAPGGLPAAGRQGRPPGLLRLLRLAAPLGSLRSRHRRGDGPGQADHRHRLLGEPRVHDPGEQLPGRLRPGAGPPRCPSLPVRGGVGRARPG